VSNGRRQHPTAAELLRTVWALQESKKDTCGPSANFLCDNCQNGGVVSIHRNESFTKIGKSRSTGKVPHNESVNIGTIAGCGVSRRKGDMSKRSGCDCSDAKKQKLERLGEHEHRKGARVRTTKPHQIEKWSIQKISLGR